MSVAGNIFENLQLSKHMIVLLSRMYLENAMNLFELDLATNLMYEGKIKGILLIAFPDGLPPKKIPKHLTHTMRRNKVLEWSDDQTAKQLVKKKLADTLRNKEDLAINLDAE